MALHERHPVVVIGAGQAGLCASYWLKRHGIDHVVLEKREVAYAWKDERWDSFCLVTPNWQCRLAGFPYQGPEPHGFMAKEEVVKYLQAYCDWVDPPLRTGVEVFTVRRGEDGEFVIETSQGTLTAAAVIVCIGVYHIPMVPPFATALPSRIRQIHSRDYRNPAQLPRGAVLVVGSGQSGCQIAEDLHLSGRKVHLCLGDAPRSPRVYRGKDVVQWLDEMGYYDIPVEEHPDVDTTRDKTNHYLTGRGGGREIDLRQMALQGMQLYGYLNDVRNSRCVFAPDLSERLDKADAVYNGIRAMIDRYIEQTGLVAPSESPYRPPWRPEVNPTSLDLDQEEVTCVIWSIGFRADFSAIDLPVFDARGCPRHQRGISSEPGLYFLGLPWLHTWGSARMSAVGRDAAHVVRHVSERLG